MNTECLFVAGMAEQEDSGRLSAGVTRVFNVSGRDGDIVL